MNTVDSDTAPQDDPVDVPEQGDSGRSQPRGGLAGFLGRLLLPVLVTLLGMVVIVRLTDGGGAATEVTTLLGRIGAGAVLIVVVMLSMRLVRTRARTVTGGGTGARPARVSAFLTGFAVWLVPALATFAVLTLLGVRWSLGAGAGRAVLLVGLLLVAVLVSEAIPEELVFRGHVTDVLSERLGGWSIIIVQAAMFTGFALALRGWTGILDLSLFAGMGVAFGYLRMVTGTVWTSIGFHTAFQTGSQLILTHEVLGFEGSATAAMVALGPVPFTVGATVVSLLAAARPTLFRRRPQLPEK
ncbi:MAG: lysostaphin resistance A-like protein [Propionibacteriaceae bacterium]